MKSYEMQLKPYLSRQVMEDSALYKEECYDYRIYCAVKDIDENGIPEFFIGVSNGINGLYFYNWKNIKQVTNRRKPCLTLMKRYWKQKGNRSIKNIQP